MSADGAKHSGVPGLSGARVALRIGVETLRTPGVAEEVVDALVSADHGGGSGIHGHLADRVDDGWHGILLVA